MRAPGLSARSLGFGFADLLMTYAMELMWDDERWRESLFAALAPRPGEAILDDSAASRLIAVKLATAFPATRFVSLERSAKALQRGRRKLKARGINNLELIAARNSSLPIARPSFDKAVSCLALHAFADKAGFLQELYRALRRGGTVYVVDFDAPADLQEQAALTIAQIVYGSDNLAPHRDGSWPGLLSRAGFSGVRRVSSHSVKAGRVSIVRGRKK